MFAIDRLHGRLLRRDRAFVPETRSWEPADRGAQDEPVDAVEAIRWLQTESGFPLRVPVGLVGPNEATDVQLAVAKEVGALLGSMRLTLMCGGRGGVMTAACQGAERAGGLTIGLLPRTDPDGANPFVMVPIATGIGEARNAIIAQASACLIAVGNSNGTLSEVALGLRMGKSIFGLAGAAAIDGVVHLANVDELAPILADFLLGAPK